MKHLALLTFGLMATCLCRLAPAATPTATPPPEVRSRLLAWRLNLPTHVDDVRRALRIFTAEAAPEATARQSRRWGLFIPDSIDPSHPLIVLIHGLDSGKECMAPLGDLLKGAGYQVGYFCYPHDQPIDDSAQLFADAMEIIAQRFPAIKVDVIAHSMGGLVARDYIEGTSYCGGVDRLILIAAPNNGSSWAQFGALAKVQEQLREWKQDPEWSWTWPITDGLGEANRDLAPQSKFLTRLNSLPRRASVRYTVIAGNQQPMDRYSAALAEDMTRCVPTKVQSWWGVRECSRGLTQCAEHLRQKTGTTDGPVKIASAKLQGVDDVVVLPADHCTLISPDRGNPPAAWEVIRERLKH